MANNRFFYNGISLREYCDQNNLRYSTIRTRLYKFSKDKKYENYSDEQLIKLAIETPDRIVEYSYKGISLKQYCEQHNENFKRIMARISSFKHNPKYSHLPIDSIIELAFSDLSKVNIRYKYQGMTLGEYCKKHCINYNVISSRIRLIRENDQYKDYSDEQVVEFAMNYPTDRVKYRYKGIPLVQYCKDHNLDINLIFSRIYDLKSYEECKNLSDDELVSLAITKSYDFKVRYKCNGVSIEEYAKTHDIKPKTIRSKLRYLKEDERYKDYTKEELVQLALSTYKKYKNIRESFLIIEKQEFSEENVKEVCNKLNLSYEHILKLSKVHSMKAAILLTWYYGDKHTDDEYKYLSDDAYNCALSLLDKMKNYDLSQKYKRGTFDIYDLVAIYKSGLYDTRDIILQDKYDYTIHVLISICRELNYYFNADEREEFLAQITATLFDFVEKVQVNIPGAMIKYMEKFIKGQFKKFLLIHKINKYNFSLYSPVGDTDKMLIEYIEDKNSGFKEVASKSFSKETKAALSKLSKPELKYIYLRFKKNYSYHELAEFYKVDIKEIKKKEKLILKKLKADENMQKALKNNRFHVS